MARAITSDVRVDRLIIGALTPEIPTPFKDILTHAQATLDELAKSAFFRMYIDEKIERESPRLPFLRIARSDRGADSEWLVITPDYKLKFWRYTNDEPPHTLYDFEDSAHDEFLLSKAESRLQQMSGTMAAMRYLISRFGATSFTVADIEAVLKRNGQLHLISIQTTAEESPVARILQDALTPLQFSVEPSRVLVAGFAELLEEFRGRMTTPGAPMVFLIDLAPTHTAELNSLAERLGSDMLRRTFVNAALGKDYYRGRGMRGLLVDRPSVEDFYKMTPDDRMVLLNSMLD